MNASERICEQAIDFSRDFLPVLLGEINSSARKWIGIRTTANGRQDNCSGMIPFQKLLRVPRPIAANLVENSIDGRAMTGVIRQNGAQFAFRVRDDKDRQIVIDWAARCPAILREPGLPLTPRQLSRFSIRQCRQRDLLHLVR